MENIISDIRYLDFINKVNKISNELLYSPEDGYFYKKGKDAIDLKEKICEKFLFEINKIKNLSKISVENEILNKRKSLFFNNVKKHYISQICIWADEVFDEFVSNFLFELSLDKSKINEIIPQFEKLINWYCVIRNLNETQSQNLKIEYNKKISNVLKNNDLDYIPKKDKNSTKPKRFLEIWNILLNDTQEFFIYKIDDVKDDLSQEDYNYFINLKNKLTTYKKDVFLDEILLIDVASKQISLEADNKYQFIKSVINDFLCFCEKNKTINENDKITLIKRRIALYKDKLNNRTQYYTQLIGTDYH